MTTKVEKACMRKHVKRITVDSTEWACVNCIWYEQYFRRGRSNLRDWQPTSTGYCLKQEKQRGPLRQPCKDFEVEKNPPSYVGWPEERRDLHE